MRPLSWGGLAAIATTILSAGAAPAPAAAADIPGNRRTKAVVTPGPTPFEGVFERQADSDWYRVALKAGRNYGIEISSSYSCSRVNVRDPAGKVLASTTFGHDEGSGGFEFRPATTGTHFLEFLDETTPATCDGDEGRFPGPYRGYIAMEVRGDTTTRATIAPGQTVAGLLNHFGDRDYFRATLDAGKTYTASVASSSHASFAVFDPQQGKGIAWGGSEPSRFKVPRTGTYYLVVRPSGYEHYVPYKLSLSTP